MHYEKIFTASSGCNHNYLGKEGMKAESACGIRESCGGGHNYHHRESRKHQISTTLNSHLSLCHPLFLPITKAAVELSTFCLCSSQFSCYVARHPQWKGTSLSFSLLLHQKINLEKTDEHQWDAIETTVMFSDAPTIIISSVKLLVMSQDWKTTSLARIHFQWVDF